MIKTLMKSIRDYKKAAIETPVFVALEVMFECILPFVMATLINNMTEDSLEPIIKYGSILLVMAMLSLLFGVLAARKAATAGAGFAKNLRHDIFYAIQDFSFADVDRFSSSSLVTRLTTDVTNIQNAFQMLIRIAVRTPLMMVFALIMSFSINPRMAVLFFLVMPIIAIALILMIKTAMPIFRRIFRKYDALNNSIQENISGIRVVKSFVREDYEEQKFSKAAEELRKDFTHVERILALNSPVMTLCMSLSMVLISTFGAKTIIASHGSALNTGDLSALITYGVQLLMSIMMLSMVFVMLTMAQESARRVTEVLTYENTLHSPENAITEVTDGSVDFNHVSFKYNEKSKRNALTDIDVHIKSGQTVGIIGGTGSSKSSLVQLIPRLYDVTEGSVDVGGVDVRKYDVDALRNQVAVVLQKNVLFSGTIKENMRWGNKNATDEEIIEACKLAQADEFVSKFPDGYDTYIEQGGTNVSGGQKQRLCIARALLKNPKVLILDDSTSAVDTKTDALIRQAFLSKIPDTTKIIIAQRISSVQDADQILVMEGGRIVEQGNHQSLMEANGIYREIYDSQTRGKEEPNA
ncbi:MAG: ABC transporter ATP-binding protein [Eubacteriales bacterium]|nr:ABC transporter ATP-binding protein [Eubacteriales bacterium]